MVLETVRRSLRQICHLDSKEHWTPWGDFTDKELDVFVHLHKQDIEKYFGMSEPQAEEDLISILLFYLPQPLAKFRLCFDREPMQKQVKKFGLPCTCQKCNPKMYELHAGAHPQIDLSVMSVNRHGTMAVDPPMLKVPTRTHDNPGGNYEAMQLAKQSISYFEKPVTEMNDTQTEAIERFKSLYEEWSDSLDAPDASQGVPNDVLGHLLQCFNQVLFFGALPTVNCRWDKSRGPNNHGVTYPEEVPMVITINPTTKPSELYQEPSRAVSHISALLHESVHAYLESYTCDHRKCVTYHHSKGYKGHGRAFLLLGCAIEAFAGKVLGVHVHLDRQGSLFHHLTEYRTLPSECDMNSRELSGLFEFEGKKHTDRSFYITVKDGVKSGIKFLV